MSLVLRTIEAFPSGRTTEELVILLDSSFDVTKRSVVVSELRSLAESGVIKRDRRGRWRPSSVRQYTSFPRPEEENTFTAGADEAVLCAVPTSISQELFSDIEEKAENEDGTTPDPNALLRYWRSALRADPRGAITQVPERHGIAWVLVTGQGPLVPGEQARRVFSVPLDSLPSEFRKALLRREANENTLAVGWPVMVGRRSGVPAVWPVGLIAAEWSRANGQLRISIEADDILVNPDWLAAAARTSGWRARELQEVFQSTDGVALTAEDFVARLREAASGQLRGKLTGIRLDSQIDMAAHGIYDIPALFLPTDSTFTAGAVRDLDVIASWPPERLSRTALAPLLGLPSEMAAPHSPDVNVGPLNGEQISAVRQACAAPLSVVTGPPGTGKSQAIVSMAATVLMHGGSVLVASKNHQALDAVEERLGALAPDLPFLVRTLDPTREKDFSVEDVLADLLKDSGGRVRPIDMQLHERLQSLAKQRGQALDSFKRRADLECEIADLVERVEARKRLDRSQVAAYASIEPDARGLLARVLSALAALFARRTATAQVTSGSLSAGAPLPALEAHLQALRRERSFASIDVEPVTLTKEIADLVAVILPSVLSHRVSMSEEERQELDSLKADLDFHENRGLSSDLVRQVLEHRPLWLASVLGTPKRIPLDDGLFDLVIFDEASQCDIASSLPLFARARRAVVVGDDRQLSFIPQLGIAQDRNLMRAQRLPTNGMGRFSQSRQSLFDFARRIPSTPRVLLRHQYRSAGPIVDYISETFYGGRLATSYDPNSIHPPEGQKPGIAWTHVPGPSLPQQGNVNPAEAEAIAKHVHLLLMEQGYEGSVGVISPFRPQVHAIETAVRARVPSQKLLGAEFRAATVDGFQGQERDVILFSPCLSGASAVSAVTFLQKDLRRLNVAISRARAVAHVFGDLTYARSGKLRALARLAAVATEPRKRTGEGVFDSEWERRVFHALGDRGLDPKPQYEIAGRRLDFALFGASGVKLDLEIDGRHWHQDADGNRKLSDLWRDHQLQSLGWRVRRFWVDELSTNMEACLELVERDLS